MFFLKKRKNGNSLYLTGNGHKKKIMALAAFMLTSYMATGCGSTYEGGLRTGPTITPAPEKATEALAEEFSLDMTDEEIQKVLDDVEQRALAQAVDYDFEITDEMTAEKSEHAGGESEVYVYDSEENMIAVLVYDDHVIQRADIDTYENGLLMSGCIYIENELSTYYETSDLNGSFRVEVSFENGNPVKYTVTTGTNQTKTYER